MTDSLPTVTLATLARLFDRGYDAIAASARHQALFATALGLPAEVHPNSFVTGAVLDEIVTALRLRPGDRLVDLGCGRGGPGLWLARASGSRLTGVDISPVAVRQAAERADLFGLTGRADFRVADFTRTGLPTACADAVVCLDSVQFAPDSQAAASEVARILRPGGRYVLTGWQARDLHDSGIPAPYRVDLGALLHAAGLAVVSIADRSDLSACEQAVFRAALADDSDDQALHHLRAEASAHHWMSALRRLLVVAER